MPNKLKVGGLEVNFSNSVKYLGVTFDNGLNWNLHFQNQIKRCKQYLFINTGNTNSRKFILKLMRLIEFMTLYGINCMISILTVSVKLLYLYRVKSTFILMVARRTPM